MRKLTLEQWQTLAQGLHREVARVAPEWTDFNVHDPGITTLELLTYALDDLHARKNSLDERAHVLARQVAEAARLLLANREAGEPSAALQRVNYFHGQLLTTEDFTAEQDYVRGRLARRNRWLHGAGIAAGLGVSIERNGAGAQAVIAPGMAFDALGREIEVVAPERLPLPAQGKALLVLLRYAERPCQPMPSLPGSTGAAMEATQYARIAETYAAALSPAADADAVALARLHRVRGRWTRDSTFRPARVRR